MWTKSHFLLLVRDIYCDFRWEHRRRIILYDWLLYYCWCHENMFMISSNVFICCMQVEAAKGFLSVLRGYLDSLCSNLRSHTITNVQSNDDKVGTLSYLQKKRYVIFFIKPYINFFNHLHAFVLQFIVMFVWLLLMCIMYLW